MKNKCLVIIVLLLFMGVSVVPFTGIAVKTTINNGNLSGYVTDTSMNPIEGALVRVYFHETYEEDYSDENGYYHVDNIPICYCMKNCTCSKEGYETEWILLSITENTTHDFVLTSLNPIPDLDCEDYLDWVDVVPGATVTGTITVENIGEPDSLLNWEIVSWPDWGTWCFDPEYGTDLLAGDMMTVNVECTVPDEIPNDLVGEIKIVNLEDPNDFEIIPVFIKGEAVPVVKNINQQFIYAFSLMRQLLGL